MDGCALVAVAWHGDMVMRVFLGACRMATGWQEDQMETGLPAAPVEANWEYAQEEALHRAGRRPR